MSGIILFTILQLINVVLQTIRAILTIKANKNVAATINAIAYTFYSAIVKLMTSQDMIIILIVTFVTNMIGVYIANWILEKTKKDKLWRITMTVNDKEIKNEIARKLTDEKIGFVESGKMIDAFSYTQNESVKVKELINKYCIKNCVTEVEKKL